MIKAEDNIALKSTKSVNDTATSALSIANSAKDIADNTNQYFWHTSTGSDTGAHITEKTQEAFLADPANGGGNLLARSNGIAVRDGLTELASFGANGMKIGKTDEKHIEVTSTAFEVYDEDGSVPFAVNTGTSLKTETTGASTQLNVSGASHQTWLTQVYLKGTLTDGKIHFGTSTSGSPSTYPSYIEPTTAGETITVNGVQCYARIISSSILQVSFRNTTSSKIYAGYQISQQFYETTVKVNDAVLDVRTDDVFAVNSTGGLRQTACYARTYGKVVSLTLAVYNTATVTPYNVIYKGKLLNYLPAGQVYITGYSAGAVVGTILADGTVTVTNSTPNSITSSEGSPIIVQGTYIFK